MKGTDISINQIMGGESQNIQHQVKNYFDKAESSVLYNASLPVKSQFLRNLVFESDLYIDNKRVIAREMTIGEKFELYVLNAFYKSTDATSIEEFSKTMEGKCKSTNEYGLAYYDEFERVFYEYLSKYDKEIPFKFFSFDELMQKYFPKSIKNIDGKKLIGFKGMRSFYKHTYELKVCINTIAFFHQYYKNY